VTTILLAHGAFLDGEAKTAEALVRYGQDPVACVVDEDAPAPTTHRLPDGHEVRVVPTVEQALEAAPDRLVVGVAPVGGRHDERILVPVANPDHVEQLMDKAVDLARDRDGELVVVSVVNLPRQTPLGRGYEYTEERRPGIDEAVAFADDHDVPVSGTIRMGSC
jgi:hypothetical protein